MEEKSKKKQLDFNKTFKKFYGKTLSDLNKNIIQPDANIDGEVFLATPRVSNGGLTKISVSGEFSLAPAAEVVSDYYKGKLEHTFYRIKVPVDDMSKLTTQKAFKEYFDKIMVQAITKFIGVVGHSSKEVSVGDCYCRYADLASGEVFVPMSKDNVENPTDGRMFYEFRLYSCQVALKNMTHIKAEEFESVLKEKGIK